MQYVFLLAAIALEVAATSLLALSEGFTRLLPAMSSLALYGASLYFLSKALRTIELGVAYATWCSVGMILTTIIAIAFFGQRMTSVGVVSVVMIIIGCVLLNLCGTVR